MTIEHHLIARTICECAVYAIRNGMEANRAQATTNGMIYAVAKHFGLSVDETQEIYTMRDKALAR